jgi:hypothetical protein
VDEPHYGFPFVIGTVSETAGGDQTNDVGLQVISSQDFIACRFYCHGFQEHFDISDLGEFPTEKLACLTLHGEVILTVFFLYAPIIKYLRTLRLVISQKFRPL